MIHIDAYSDTATYMMYSLYRAVCEKHGSVAMIHIDAHSDTATDMMGERLAHGTPFRKSFF